MSEFCIFVTKKKIFLQTVEKIVSGGGILILVDLSGRTTKIVFVSSFISVLSTVCGKVKVSHELYIVYSPSHNSLPTFCVHLTCIVVNYVTVCILAMYFNIHI